MTAEEIERVVDANAAMLRVRIAAEHRKGVLAFYALASRMAELVDGLPLTPADEPAAVFTPIAPHSDET